MDAVAKAQSLIANGEPSRAAELLRALDRLFGLLNGLDGDEEDDRKRQACERKGEQLGFGNCRCDE